MPPDQSIQHPTPSHSMPQHPPSRISTRLQSAPPTRASPPAAPPSAIPSAAPSATPSATPASPPHPRPQPHPNLPATSAPPPQPTPCPVPKAPPSTAISLASTCNSSRSAETASSMTDTLIPHPGQQFHKRIEIWHNICQSAWI